MLVDSHCHLDFDDFAPERGEVIARARRAGVGTMLTICTKVTEFERVRAIAEADPDIWCSVGIHPHEAAHQPETDTATLVELARHPKVVGIGETGLDFHYDLSPRPVQEASFRRSIAAAKAAGKPVVVHVREADAACARVLAEEGVPAAGGVIHCFTGDWARAKAYLDLGLYLSIAGVVTFKTADDLRDAVRRAPRDRVLVETDSPFLAPVPHRGKRNEPAYVARTADRVAALWEVSPEEVGEITTANARRFFGLP
jgi:TatD DNase family protein